MMRIALALTFLLVSAASLAAADTQQEHARARAQLEALQAEIEARRESVQQRQQRLSGLEQALRDIEQRMNQSTQAIQATARQLEQNQQRITELEQQQAALEADLARQAELLADQIESAYRSGRHDFIQMLLNQQDPARIERVLAYYRYVNDARIEQLEELRETEAELDTVVAQLTDQRQELQNTMAQQQRQRDQLQAQQAEQERSARELRTAQANDETELEDMRQSEQQLTELLASLEDVLSEQQIDLAGLEALQGRLGWPVEGSIRHNYGQRRSGQVNWKGVVLNTQAETPVRVIADGRVLFSDWLRGFGLVIVVDHGEGYMSLYGYNQSLTRDVGEEVRRGDTIALTGQSGGQERPGLYFEIRREGNPVNPNQYLR
ncbi:murein hydrolase activator EnvC family protein [Aliidiomarina sp. Khilg15.8]